MENDTQDPRAENLREEIDWRLDQMMGEMERLRQENRRLLEENKGLREEVTLVRLQGSGKLPERNNHGELPGSESLKALTFYHRLPQAFNFTGFFREADDFGLTNREAKDFLLYFIDRDLLIPRGPRVKKPDYSQRLVPC